MAAASVPEVGAPLSKSVVNAQVGAAAQSFKRGLDELITAYEWSTAYSAAQLEALGFTAEEANLLKSALSDITAVEQAVHAAPHLKFLWAVGI